MGIVETITTSQIIALDTNIFIYALDTKNLKGDTARKILAKIKRVSPRVFISVLTFEEFLVRIYKQKLEKDLAYYEEFLTGGGIITVLNIDRQIARVAAKIRAEFKSIRAPDALHLASALTCGAKTFITGERRLPKKIGQLTISSL